MQPEGKGGLLLFCKVSYMQMAYPRRSEKTAQEEFLPLVRPDRLKVSVEVCKVLCITTVCISPSETSGLCVVDVCGQVFSHIVSLQEERRVQREEKGKAKRVMG